MAHRFHLVETYDVGDRGARARVPALLLAGDRDLLVSEQGLETLAGALPDARPVSLPGCGHLAFVTHPDRVAAEVVNFLGSRI